jgi:hypothetical protein
VIAHSNNPKTALVDSTTSTATSADHRMLRPVRGLAGRRHPLGGGDLLRRPGLRF